MLRIIIIKTFGEEGGKFKAFPFAGIIQIRYRGYYLSLTKCNCETPLKSIANVKIRNNKSNKNVQKEIGKLTAAVAASRKMDLGIRQ